MKTDDLTDYVVFQDNTQLAFDTLSEQMDRKEFLILMFHVGMKWRNVNDCTEDMVANVATILMSEYFTQSYLKYMN
jgi:hypothetical protein